jgi:hypothetical protein
VSARLLEQAQGLSLQFIKKKMLSPYYKAQSGKSKEPVQNGLFSAKMA